MTEKVLLVEDDADLREALTETLRDEGYDVAAASHGLEALERLREGLLPDVILLDLMMPVMNGWEFRARQREDAGLAAIPVILLSAAHDLEVQRVELEARDAVRKPVPRERLLASIRKALSS